MDARDDILTSRMSNPIDFLDALIKLLNDYVKNNQNIVINNKYARRDNILSIASFIYLCALPKYTLNLQAIFTEARIKSNSATLPNVSDIIRDNKNIAMPITSQKIKRMIEKIQKVLATKNFESTSSLKKSILEKISNTAQVIAYIDNQDAEKQKSRRITKQISERGEQQDNPLGLPRETLANVFSYLTESQQGKASEVSSAFFSASNDAINWLSKLTKEFGLDESTINEQLKEFGENYKEMYLRMEREERPLSYMTIDSYSYSYKFEPLETINQILGNTNRQFHPTSDTSSTIESAKRYNNFTIAGQSYMLGFDIEKERLDELLKYNNKTELAKHIVKILVTKTNKTLDKNANVREMRVKMQNGILVEKPHTTLEQTVPKPKK